jgi:hypothetical protein
MVKKKNLRYPDCDPLLPNLKSDQRLLDQDWLFSINFRYVMQATVFYVISSLLPAIPPFLIAYRSQSFWIRTGYLA